MRKRCVLQACAVALCVALLAVPSQAGTVKAYGPGGPAPAMKEASALFQKQTGTEVQVTPGPTGNWLAKAKTDADIVFSGSENMMLGFMAAFDGQIVSSTVEPLYLRPATLLVRKGNPKGIKGMRDLAKPGMTLLVTEGAGQVGMWEDVAGRTGDLALLKAVRRNIREFAANSGLALQSWKDKPEIDAWLIWNHWQVANPDFADQVAVEPNLVIWRSSDVALTERAKANAEAKAFVEFLKSPDAVAIFRKFGWSR